MEGEKLTWHRRQLSDFPLDEHKGNQAQPAEHEHDYDHDAAPFKVGPPAGDGDQEQDHARRAEEGPDKVNLAKFGHEAATGCLLREDNEYNAASEYGQRRYEPEHGSPCGRLGEGRCEERADDVSQTDARSQNPLIPT